MTTTHWRLSSFCSAGGCVAVRRCPDGGVQVARTDPIGPGPTRLDFTAAEWDAFVAGVKTGEFDWLPGD